MRTCPKCKTSDYNNRYFMLMINECGHSLCKNCVDTLFIRQSGPCPACGRNLKKSTFWEQIFDDPQIEKQTYYRKKLQKVFNLKQDDFPTLRLYNDYLEMVETYVFNLAFDTDVDETKRRIEQFQKDNEELIIRNKNRLSKDEEWIQKYLDDERRNKENPGFRNDPTEAASETVSKASFEEDAKSVIAELMNSETDASQIVGKKRYEAMRSKEEAELKRAALGAKRSADELQRCLLRKKLRGGKSDQEIVSLESTLGADLGSPFAYSPENLHLNGPALPDVENLAASGYLAHIKQATGWQTAGGYYEALGCYRALTECFCDLFL